MANEQPTKASVIQNEIETAISAGASLANAKTNPHPHGEAYAIVPQGSKIEYLTKPEFPPRRAGTVKLNDTESFLEYWARQAYVTILNEKPDSFIYGSLQPAQFVAVFNEHSSGHADWRDHRAVLTLAHSQEWQTWAGKNRQAFNGNEEFATWLEDNLIDIVNPDPAKFMDIALNFKVSQGQNFAKAVNLGNGMIDLTYANTVEASGGAGKVQIPSEFVIAIPVWQGLEAQKYEVTARFRYTLQSGSLKIRYELIRPHKVVEQAFKDCLDKIESAAKTNVLFGTPE